MIPLKLQPYVKGFQGRDCIHIMDDETEVQKREVNVSVV